MANLPVLVTSRLQHEVRLMCDAGFPPDAIAMVVQEALENVAPVTTRPAQAATMPRNTKRTPRFYGSTYAPRTHMCAPCPPSMGVCVRCERLVARDVDPWLPTSRTCGTGAACVYAHGGACRAHAGVWGQCGVSAGLC